jgi:uncharacterized damage-inducible protein DinB
MKLYFSILFLFYSFSGIAQNATADTLKKQMIRDWERAKTYTQEYLDAMPADKYSFRPVDSVRTFAEQMLHFSQANAGMGYIGTGFNFNAMQVYANPNFEKSPTAQSKDSVIYYVNKSYDFVIEALKQLDFTKINETVSFQMPGGMRTTTRLGWLLKAFEHQTHHRGQCTIYLRLSGIKPPGEKLFE